MNATALPAFDPAASVHNYVQSIRSDELPQLAAFLQRIALFKDEVTLFRFEVILDANIVLRDLMWLSKPLRKPGDRTEMLELIECDIVRAHAPTFLIEELN